MEKGGEKTEVSIGGSDNAASLLARDKELIVGENEGEPPVSASRNDCSCSCNHRRPFTGFDMYVSSDLSLSP